MRRAHYWAAMLLLTVALLAGCGVSAETEAAWRTATGLDAVPDRAWHSWRDHVYDICDDEEDVFKLFIAIATDQDGLKSLGRLRNSLSYACPERAELFDETVASQADPCAGMTPAERREHERQYRAMWGEPGYTCP